MRRFRNPAWVALVLTAVCFLLSAISRAAPAKEKSKPPTVRWDEEHTGCTFSRSPDGKYHYGLWSGDLGITMIVDAQEVEKVRRRSEPFFGVLLDVRYLGKDKLDLDIGNISLEFVNHFKVIQNALGPNSFAEKIQKDADELDHQTAREIVKHPEQKEAKEAYARSFQEETAELREFVSKNSLRTTRLDPANPAVSGWVLFGVDNKWLGGWKQQEEFVLRVELGGKIFEFPFKLPPKPGELLLRKRE